MNDTFFIIETITGDCYVGKMCFCWKGLNLTSDPIQIGNIYIPFANIDYVKVNVPFREFMETCEHKRIIKCKL